MNHTMCTSLTTLEVSFWGTNILDGRGGATRCVHDIGNETRNSILVGDSDIRDQLLYDMVELMAY